MFAIAKLIGKMFGMDIGKAQRWVLAGTAVLVLLVILASGLWVRSCINKRSQPKLNQDEIQALQWAQETRDLEAQRKILVESDARNAEINATAANATTEKVNAIAESKARWANASEEEMGIELEARK